MIRKNLNRVVLTTTIFIFTLSVYFISNHYSSVIWKNPTLHFYYVPISTLASILVGVLAYREYRVTKDFKVYLLAVGFIGIGIIYSFHGLITPGKSICDFSSSDVHLNAFVFYGDMSRLWIGILMFFQWNSRRERSSKFNALGTLIFIVTLLLGLCLLSLNYSQYIPAIKDAYGFDTKFTILIKVITLVLLGVSCTRYYDSYRIINNIPVITLMLSSLLISGTVILFMLSRPWDITWWLAHHLYLASFISVGFGLWFSWKYEERFQFFNTHKQIELYVAMLNQKNIDLKNANERLEELAIIDTLTGLYNRNYINNFYQKEFEKSRNASTSLAMLFIDLDGFKNVNDTYGHDVGDLLLKMVGEEFKKCIRSEDLVARLGGDEFLIILQNVKRREKIIDIVQRIMDRMSKPFDFDGYSCEVGASIGISQYPEHGEEFDTLIRYADMAMYTVKNSGKNNYLFYDEMLNKDTLQKA